MSIYFGFTAMPCWAHTHCCCDSHVLGNSRKTTLAREINLALIILR